MIQVHNLGQGHKTTVRNPDRDTRQGRKPLALVLWQLYTNFHFIPAILVDLGNATIKGRPELATQIRRGQPQRLTIGTHLVNQLLPPPGHVIFHIKYARQRRQRLPQFVGGLL